MNQKPPRWASLLLRVLCEPHLFEEIEGDLYERYARDIAKDGKRAADRRYVINVTGFLRLKFGIRQAGWSTAVRLSTTVNSKPNMKDMFNSYLKVSLRNIWRNRSTNVVNVLGLSAGIASGLVIFLLVNYLFSFNSDFENSGATYMVTTDILHENVEHTDVVPRPMGEVLRKEYPIVKTAVRLNNLGGIIAVPNGKGGFEKKFEESRNICFTEPQFFDVFDTEWVLGNPKIALKNPNEVVLSKAYADKYFGEENVLGKILRFDNRVDLTVTGIIENPRSNTQLHYDVLISYATIPGFSGDPEVLFKWSDPSTMLWVTLNDNKELPRFEKSLNEMRLKYYNAKDAAKYSFQVIPLTEMFHHPSYGRAPRPILYALIVVGLCLVLASCVNFINLSTAQAIKRSREVGVRKSLGSTRTQLVGQFMLETSVICGAAFVVALLLTQLCLPILNNALWMLHADISVFHLFTSKAWLWFGGLLAGVTLLAGFYPSLVLARFNPVAALKGTLTTQRVGNLSVRRGLVVVQFFITQLFIIGVLVMSAQVKYLKSADPGFEKNNQVSVMLPTSDAAKKEIFRQKLMNLKAVELVSFCDFPPATQYRNFSEFTYDSREKVEKFVTNIREGDSNYVPLFELKLLAGRNFITHNIGNQGDSAQVNHEVLINEKMVKQLGIRSLDEVLDKPLTLSGKQMTVVGVVKDFGLGSIKDDIQPVTIVSNSKDNFRSIIKVSPGDLSGTVSQVEQIWNDLYSDGVFKAQFVDDLVSEFYTTENILLGLIQAFSVVAILIGCLGLFGLVTFISESKNKEIGVRKVLGANLQQLLWIFGREFGLLMLLGFLAAAPLGWFLMNAWLHGYAHRIVLGLPIFALSAALVAVITLLTISFQALKAVRVNPVKSLKSE
jgi:putative ABC transport system permease protein